MQKPQQKLRFRVLPPKQQEVCPYNIKLPPYTQVAGRIYFLATTHNNSKYARSDLASPELFISISVSGVS